MDEKSIFNFAGIEPEYSALEKSKITVLPVPYDLTSTYISGTREGPRAIIEASQHMELYDEEIEKETYRVGIHTNDQLEVRDEKPEDTPRRAVFDIGPVGYHADVGDKPQGDGMDAAHHHDERSRTHRVFHESNGRDNGGIPERLTQRYRSNGDY